MRKYSLILILLCTFFGCKKIDIPIPSPLQKIDIYIAGTQKSNSVPFYLKNGEFKALPKDQSMIDPTVLNDFLVSNGKIYATYSNVNNRQNSYYTINDQIFKFNIGDAYELLYLKNNELYISGISIQQFISMQVIWKNGTIIQSIERNEKVIDLVVDENNNLYEGLDYTNIYYKNGEQFVIEYFDYNRGDRLTDMIVKNGDLYISGYLSGYASIATAGYWINGKFNFIPTNGRSQAAYKIAATKNDLYVLVKESNSLNDPIASISYYKNNKKVSLPIQEGNLYSQDMFMYNDDIYILVSIISNNVNIFYIFKNENIIAEYQLPEYTWADDLVFYIEKKI